MIIVITDACFLIDLIDIDLFDEFLGLGYQVHITSSVFAELEGDKYAKPVGDGFGKSTYHSQADHQPEEGT